MAPVGRLTKKSLAVRMLRSKFEKGEVTGEESPKAVWESDVVFQKHKLGNFRTCYNSMRTEFGSKPMTRGVEADDSRDGVALDRRCNATEGQSSARKRRASNAFVQDDEESEEEDVDIGAGVELTTGELAFKPLFMISSWIERSTLTKRLCVAIILPSGEGSGDFTIIVVDGGHFLQLAVRWPKPLVDVLVMHRWKLSNPDNGFMPYHPSVIGFESALSELRKRSSDSVESVARISLPFEVLTQVVSKNNLSFKEGGGTKMLYVDLKAAAVEEYGVEADTEEFTEV